MGDSMSRAEEVLDKEKFSFSLEIIQLILSNYFLCAFAPLRETILLIHADQQVLPRPL